MRFHLNHTAQKPDFQIAHSDKVFLIGSCFSENIGEKLKNARFEVLSNPSGNLFNPFSIQTNLLNFIAQEKSKSDLFIQRDNSYSSYLYHSSINADSENDLRNKIDEISQDSFLFLKTCNYIFITFGTAFYYQHKFLKTIVANCHKQSADTFEKRLAKPEEIVSVYESLLKKIKTLNPEIKIVFTVSPVKHLKDGLVENTLSKATLLLAVHQLIAKNADYSYFPAYELVTDDLRDYRFYKEDMAHPNEQAISYVWDKFSECYFSPKTLELNQKIHKLQLALNHRKMQENEEESRKLNEFILKQKEEIRKLYPEIRF